MLALLIYTYIEYSEECLITVNVHSLENSSDSGHGDILGPSLSRPQEVDERGEKKEATKGDQNDAET